MEDFGTVVDLEFRERGSCVQSVQKKFVVPHPLLVITSETTATCHMDLGKFPFYNIVIEENEAIENHCCNIKTSSMSSL